jgi:Transglutaminase-like superfamily
MRNFRLFHADSWCRRVGWLLCAISLSCAIALFLSWHQDEVVLRQQAIMITENFSTDSARIRAVNNWVYHNKGFAPNDRYFIIPALGPSPIQVMEQGGDCSDKSRLVAAMLNSIGIDAGLVMISPCLYCGFIHTVVEAQYEKGRMVVDPIWNIDYPTGDGRFLGVKDLAGTNRGQERVVELQRQRPTTDKIAHMPPMDAVFDYATPINWDANNVTRTVAAMLTLTGYPPETVFRPRLLEDPKLLLIFFLIGMATGFVVGGFLLDFALRSVMTRIPRRITDTHADKLGTTDA